MPNATTEEDSDEDVAKPAADWRGVWNKALWETGMPTSGKQISVSDMALLLKGIDSKEDLEKGLVSKFGLLDLGASQVVSSSGKSDDSPSLPATSRKSSIAFKDKEKVKGNGMKLDHFKGKTGEDMMFKRCKQTKIYTTEDGLGGSFMVVREEDAEDEWEELDGADVDDDWDFVAEAERFKIDGQSKQQGFNGKMRGYFEKERGKREKDSKARKL